MDEEGICGHTRVHGTHGACQSRQGKRLGPTNALAEVALGVLREGAHEVPRLLARDPLQVLLRGRAQRAGLFGFWVGVWLGVCGVGGWLVKGVGGLVDL